MSPTDLPAKASATEALEQRMDRLPALDTSEVVERTIGRMLNATTADALFASPEAAGLRDYAGQVVELVDVIGCLPSTKKGALSRYLVLTINDLETGEQVAVTTGALNACTAALRAKELGLLPRKLRVLELESASNPGQSSLWLVNA